MVSETFLRGRKELFKRLKKGVVLTDELEKIILDVYGSRGKRALETIKKRGVAKRGERWFVRGIRGAEYEVVRNYCSCRDYVFNIVTGKADVDCCYHALAKNICEILKSYYVFERES